MKPPKISTFTELSMLYFPELSKRSANKQFKVWINRNEKLKQEMLEAGYKLGIRYITPRLLEIIFNHLGQPDMEK